MTDDLFARPLGRRSLIGAAAALPLLSSAASAATPAVLAAALPLRQINAGDLSVSYADIGPRGGAPLVLLHGWPYDIYSFAEAVPYLVAAGHRVIVPFLRGYGGTRFLSDKTPRNGQPAALASDVIALMDALNIAQAVVAGFDWGARSANIVAAIWPERVRAMVSVSGYLIGSRAANAMPLPPTDEKSWWYQFYFATERGRIGYDKNRHAFAKLIWQTASPRWAFDDATFDLSAKALANPDQVDITIHNYRWRLSLAEGEARYDALEARIEQRPDIGVPSITLEGDANGAPHPSPESYAAKFTGKHVHRLIGGGIGHNLPQEAPKAFADAVLQAAALAA